ncbi:hypothetical protein J1N35_004938 [Gossypium stocksii]|uniref:Uncharacterized protein n=1 Tax=Gossypium stocksii TaxID=47602 RepID=A0A9D3WEK6_9ROSI|nr:hypothetical protein J1N35_004938 [Gossypium stocksii]
METCLAKTLIARELFRKHMEGIGMQNMTLLLHQSKWETAGFGAPSVIGQ